jgi:hypothetical protein
MRPMRPLQAGIIACGIVLGSLVFSGGCGGGAPPTGAQVQDMPSPINLSDVYKKQPKASTPKATPKYDMPGR